MRLLPREEKFYTLFLGQVDIISEAARLLLEAGADPNALAEMYDAECTTLSMLVSSSHPAEAGVQGALAELLLVSWSERADAGAASTSITASAAAPDGRVARRYANITPSLSRAYGVS